MAQEDGLTLNDFQKAEQAFSMLDEVVPDFENGMKVLKGHTLKTMSVQLRTHVNDLSAYVTKQLHPSETKRVVWEVYCGASRMSQVAESLGMTVRQFSLEIGWDFQSIGPPTAVLGST